MGKPAVAFSPHGGRPGQTNETFKKWIESPWDDYGGCHNNQTANNNEKETKELFATVSALMNGYFF